MESTETSPAAIPSGLERVVGCHEGSRPGPLVICTGGVHGNEPAGVHALRRVLAALGESQPDFRGRLVALAGNLGALQARVRFVNRDLNRMWVDEQVADLRQRGPNGCPEAREQYELIEVLQSQIGADDRELYFLDLHTSSATGVPFACIGDTLRNRRFARAFPLPVLLGLEEQVDGALLEFLNNRGAVTVGVEGGQHDSEHSVSHLEAVVWIALLHAGCLSLADLDADLRRHVRESVSQLRSAVANLPRFLEIRYRHHVDDDDGFEMAPGYEHFQPVEAGEVLARDRLGEIRSFYRCRVLLPLYQKKGEDGFFLAREVRPFWLRVSRVLRLLHFDRLIHWLPGVERDPEQRDTLLVDPRVARWYVIEIFHLLGFRKRRSVAGKLVVSRRRFDLRPPQRFSI